MFAQAFATPVLGLLNRILAEQPAMRGELAAQAGKTVVLTVAGLPLRLAIGAAGELEPAAATRVADVEVEIPAAALPHLLEGAAAVQARARIRGDVGLAELLPRLAASLQPEVGALLSPLVGDILANRIERGLAALAAAGRRSIEGLGANLSEYLREESGLAVSQAEASRHRRELECLAADLNALEQRLARL